MHVQDGFPYLSLRLLHIVGAMVFTGALVLAAALKVGTDRSGDAGRAAGLHRALRKADGLVVGPAALATFVGGYAMVRFLGGRIAQHWFAVWGLVLLFLALAFWYFGIRRLNQRLADEADARALAKQPLGREYAKLSVAWLGAVVGALASLVAAAIVMVFRYPLGIA